MNLCISSSVSPAPLSEKLKEYSVTALMLLNSMRQYKNYQFAQQMSEDSSIEEATNKVQGGESKNIEKMECMPEIPYFNEILGSVNKTQPIEERLREINFDIIFSKLSISNESVLKARLTFSKFINDFVSKYASDKKVKLLDFLKQLQEFVIEDSEIESFNNIPF